MKTRSTTFQIENELQWEKTGEGVRRQIMGYDGHLMIVKVEFEKGAEGYLHEHYHSQASYIASGKFEANVDGIKKNLEVGDGFYVEPDVIHGVVCLEKGVIIDVFSPHRADFLRK